MSVVNILSFLHNNRDYINQYPATGGTNDNDKENYHTANKT